MSPSDMFGSKHFATGCATMNINVNIMLTPIHIIRMAPISLEFTKEHKTSFFRGCASSRGASSPLDEAQPWKMIFFLSSLVNLCLPDHRLFCLSKNLKESVKKQKNVTFVSFFPLSLSVFFLSFFSFYSAFVFFRFCCFAFSLFRRWYFFRFFRVFREVRICYGLDDINLPKKIKKISFSKVVLHRGEMKRNPAFGGATKLIFVR